MWIYEENRVLGKHDFTHRFFFSGSWVILGWEEAAGQSSAHLCEHLQGQVFTVGWKILVDPSRRAGLCMRGREVIHLCFYILVTFKPIGHPKHRFSDEMSNWHVCTGPQRKFLSQEERPLRLALLLLSYPSLFFHSLPFLWAFVRPAFYCVLSPFTFSHCVFNSFIRAWTSWGMSQLLIYMQTFTFL